MEAAVVSALMTNIVARLFAVLEKRYDQLSALHDDIDSMKAELHLIAGAMEDQLSQKGHTRAVERISMTVMRELAFDIEDCLDRFLPCAACGEEAGSIGDPVYFVDEIQKLKKRLEGAHQQKTNYGVKGGQQQDSQDRQGHPIASHDADTFEEHHHHHVGIEKPKQEVVDLLEVEGEKLMVISIVGFGGSGKTALTKAVYHCPQVRRKFLRRAWVVASKHKDDAKGLLTAILQQLLPSEAPAVLPTQQVPQLQQHIIHHLQARSTRCRRLILHGRRRIKRSKRDQSSHNHHSNNQRSSCIRLLGCHWSLWVTRRPLHATWAIFRRAGAVESMARSAVVSEELPMTVRWSAGGRRRNRPVVEGERNGCGLGVVQGSLCFTAAAQMFYI